MFQKLPRIFANKFSNKGHQDANIGPKEIHPFIGKVLYLGALIEIFLTDISGDDPGLDPFSPFSLLFFTN
jgi:hypothetical protein